MNGEKSGKNENEGRSWDVELHFGGLLWKQELNEWYK